MKPRIRLAKPPVGCAFIIRQWECVGCGTRAFGLTPYLAWKHWRDHLYAVAMAREIAR